MSDDFYPFVDSGDPAPDNSHITGENAEVSSTVAGADQASYATRIAVYDDMLSTPRVIVIPPRDVRSYLEEITNTVYRCMKEQGGGISLMVIREIVENFIHAHFVEPIISILDGGQTIRFADQGPGIEDKERAFEFGVTSADRSKKRYIRGTGAGFPMIQQYLENAGGAVSIEDNLGQGTVVTVSLDPTRVEEIERASARGAAVRGGGAWHEPMAAGAAAWAQPVPTGAPMPQAGAPIGATPGMPMQQAAPQQAVAAPQQPMAAAGYGYPGAMMQGAATNPYAYQQPYPQQNPYGTYAPQPMGYPQPNPYPGMPGAMPMPAQPMMPQPQQPYITERGMLALRFLMDNGSCGPTDLAGAFGSSTPTWSRELDALTTAGLVIKRGQKRVLTDMGRMWMQEQQPGMQG